MKIEFTVETAVEAYQTLHDLADAYARGDEEAVATLVYEIYCDYHVSNIVEEVE